MKSFDSSNIQVLRLMFPGIRKYFRPSNYYDYALETVRNSLPNYIVNKTIHSADWSELSNSIKHCELAHIDIDTKKLQKWTSQFYPNYRKIFGDLEHKKLIEFYTTYSILNPKENHVFMDVAGGQYSYLGNLNCEKKILHDIKIDKNICDATGVDVEYIESDAGHLPLPDESIDQIACHHSFEHFKKDSDIRFLKEIQRLLKAGGLCCIVPLFVASKYAEITDKITFKLKFDHHSRRIIDPTASIPGCDFSGNYARIYDIPAFMRRIVGNVNLTKFKVTIFELQVNREPFPNMALKINKRIAGLEHPYRALVLRKSA